jgi:hypothetical protein
MGSTSSCFQRVPSCQCSVPVVPPVLPAALLAAPWAGTRAMAVPVAPVVRLALVVVRPRSSTLFSTLREMCTTRSPVVLAEPAPPMVALLRAVPLLALLPLPHPHPESTNLAQAVAISLGVEINAGRWPHGCLPALLYWSMHCLLSGSLLSGDVG